jgi:ribosome-associated protein YbcJ (S4-like RNA binding protein)
MPLRQKIFESNNKGLFDIAVGEGNISSDFATELQNSRVAQNGEVSKRRGRTFLNATAAEHAAGNSIDSYGILNRDDVMSMYLGNNEELGVSVALTGQDIQSVKFYLKKTGLPTGGLKAKIYLATGTVGSTAVPTGSALAESILLDPADITGSYVLTEFTFEEPYTSTTADYCIAIEYNGGDASNSVDVGADSSTPGATANTFATNTKGSGWAADATQDLIYDIIKAGPTCVMVAVYEGDYPGTYEILGQFDTRLLRYTQSTGAFDVVVKTGLTADTPLNWAMASNKMILTNGTDPAFKYGYTPKPASTATGTTTSGAKSLRTYYVSVTYVTAGGESIPSPETTQVVAANDVLDVTALAALQGATGWNVYYSETSGSLLLQNASPLTLGVNHQETTGALNDGAAPPSTHTGYYAIDLLDNPPLAKYVFSLNNRVWFSGITNRKTQFVGSAVDDEDDWSTASDYIDIDLAAVLARGDTITGLNRLGQTNALIVALKNHIVTYTVPATFSDIAIDKTVYNTGAMSHRAMDEVGLDNYLVETGGLNSIKNELIVQGLKTRKLSDNIRDRINPLLKAVSNQDEVNVVNHKSENEFWVNIPSINRRYIYDYEIKSWMEDRDITIYQSVVTPDDNILSAGKYGRVYREYVNSSGEDVYGDGHNNVPVSWQWDTPWLWFDNISVKKMFKYFQFKGSGAAGLFNLDVSFDFDSTSYKTFYLQTTLSEWEVSQWDSGYWDFPDVNKVLIPMIGMGRAVKFSFTATHKTDISIAFYGVKYANAGFRAND